MVEVQAFMAAERRLSTEQRALMAAGTSVAEGIRALAMAGAGIRALAMAGAGIRALAMAGAGIRALAMAGAGIRALAVVAGNITDDVGANVHTRAGREISLRRFEEFFLRDGSGEDGLVLQ
jgi:hypothetical protein